MQDKEAVEILIRLMNKDSLSAEEKEAIRVAIGILSWSKLGQVRVRKIIQSQKEKREKSLE